MGLAPGCLPLSLFSRLSRRFTIFFSVHRVGSWIHEVAYGNAIFVLSRNASLLISSSKLSTHQMCVTLVALNYSAVGPTIARTFWELTYRRSPPLWNLPAKMIENPLSAASARISWAPAELTATIYHALCLAFIHLGHHTNFTYGLCPRISRDFHPIQVDGLSTTTEPLHAGVPSAWSSKC